MDDLRCRKETMIFIKNLNSDLFNEIKNEVTGINSTFIIQRKTS